MKNLYIMICYILLLFVFNNINIIKKWDNNNKYVLCLLASNAKISKLMSEIFCKQIFYYYSNIIYFFIILLNKMCFRFYFKFIFF